MSDARAYVVLGMSGMNDEVHVWVVCVAQEEVVAAERVRLANDWVQKNARRNTCNRYYAGNPGTNNPFDTEMIWEDDCSEPDYWWEEVPLI